jgi:DNA-binding winged helix-turn-helix (wHTH) protein
LAVAVFEFGDFRLDCDRFELHRAGRSLKLERKPMELLILLAARNGHLVTRAEIAERLWDREVFVDTEHGINTAIRKIRQVLGDDPEQPRFLLTVTGKGYRFIGAAAEVPPYWSRGKASGHPWKTAAQGPRMLLNIPPSSPSWIHQSNMQNCPLPANPGPPTIHG